ncbi:MAG: glutamine--fructose-6-phosphate transaminase (isomerizing) [Candidatus Parvarchaeota archaeon]|jgi:glucosamine--fructose-6-phosphate aminotransferase (isomerizing)|nr:glutamine--fructose-6-phosphate transaminase (isomerizing) [Candidatus Parvarchaeota archaeon]MCL5106649.1 glutamine--fructose-6-phosphate transaminase (isomerizing) [Candidatus Parvarchaeota archaeon]
MCGIIGYNGSENSIPLVLEGIKNLEYRGYDSFGCAFQGKNNNIEIRKDTGRINRIIDNYGIDSESSNKSIAHTRWATHGGVTKANSHPLLDCTGKIAVVHNGIIENFQELKDSLPNHSFSSETDTEVLPHLIEEEIKNGKSFEDAVISTAGKIKGFSSFVVMNSLTDNMIAVKNGSPLVLGVKENGVFVASDVPSFLKHTNKVVYLFDGDVISVNKTGFKVLKSNNMGKHKVREVSFSASDVDKGTYRHFMIKEIMEQQNLVSKLVNSDLSYLKNVASAVSMSKKVFIVGSGSSFHVALLTASLFRDLGKESIAVQPQDLLNYSKTIGKEDIFMIISQSGETMDIIESLPIINGNKKIGIINTEGSTLANSVDYFINVNAGHEKGVAATKTFTMSAILSCLIAMFSAGEEKEALNDLNLLNINLYNLFVPSVYKTIKETASIIKGEKNLFFLGRGNDYISAMEAALKMKEITYIHAEAIDAATFKHGPLALISKGTYSIALVSDRFKDREINNLKEIKARDGKIIGIANEKLDVFDVFIRSQPAGIFSFVPQIITSQLLSYYVSLSKHIDPDHPRNLAKAVTTK